MPQQISRERKTLLFGTAFIADIIFFDQITKWLMQEEQHIAIFDPWFGLHYAENKGIAFSMPLQGAPQQIVTVLLIALLIMIMIRYKTWQRRWLHVSLVLIIGGAIGNAVDRLWRGYVIDFIQVGTFPVFNLADTCVTLGVIGVIIYELAIRPRLNERQTMTPPSPPQP